MAIIKYYSQSQTNKVFSLPHNTTISDYRISCNNNCYVVFTATWSVSPIHPKALSSRR